MAHLKLAISTKSTSQNKQHALNSMEEIEIIAIATMEMTINIAPWSWGGNWYEMFEETKGKVWWGQETCQRAKRAVDSGALPTTTVSYTALLVTGQAESLVDIKIENHGKAISTVSGLANFSNHFQMTTEARDSSELWP
jgi:hypothetical protein